MAQVKAMTESAGSFQRLRKGLPMPFSSHSAASSRTDRSGRSIGFAHNSQEPSATVRCPVTAIAGTAKRC
jgi:hypothetical protein